MIWITGFTEYILASSCYSQLLWIKHQLEDYNLFESKIPILCDNTTAIDISKKNHHAFTCQTQK